MSSPGTRPLRRFDRRRTFVSYAVRDLPLSGPHLERLGDDDEFVFLDYPQRWSTLAQRAIVGWLRRADRLILRGDAAQPAVAVGAAELATARRFKVAIEPLVLL